MPSIGKIVSAPVKFIGEAVSSVADFAMDAVIKPVINVAAGVVKGMADDPLGTILQIAAMASGNPTIAAVVAATNSARNGGSPLAIIASTAAAYYGTPGVREAGQAASFTTQIGNVAASAVARQIINAAVSGGDTVEAGRTAAASAAATEAISIRENVGEEISEVELEYFQGTEFTDNFNIAKEGITGQLKNIVEGWDDLPDLVKEVIAGSAAAGASSLTSGGNVPSEEQINAVLTPAITTAETTKSAILGKDLPNNTVAQIARVIGDISRTAYEGTDPNEARKVNLSNEFKTEIARAVDAVVENNNLNDEFTSISESVSAFEGAVEKANETAIPVDAAGDKVNEVIARTETLKKGEVEGFSSLEQWQEDNAVYEAGGRTDEEARDKLVAWNDEYKKITVEIPPLRAEYDALLETHTNALDEIDVAESALLTNQSNLDDATKPFYKEISKAFTVSLRPDFNEEEYREINSIDSGADAHAHWLVTGRSNLVNNQEVADRKSPFAGEEAVELTDSAPDVTDVDIASGKARLEKTSDGTYRFTKDPIEVSKRFDPRYNREVTTTFNLTENEYVITGNDNEKIDTVKVTENPDGSFTTTSTSEYSVPISVAAMRERVKDHAPTLDEMSSLNPVTAINAASKLFKSVTTGSTGSDADGEQRQPFTLTSTLDPNSTTTQDIALIQATKAAGIPAEGFVGPYEQDMRQLTNTKEYYALLDQVLKKYGNLEAFKTSYLEDKAPKQLASAEQSDSIIADDAGKPIPWNTPTGPGIDSDGFATMDGMSLEDYRKMSMDPSKSFIPEGVTLTSTVKDLLEYSRPTTEQTPPATNAEIKDVGGLSAYIDLNFTNSYEAEMAFKQLGYTPTPEEVESSVGTGLQTETVKRIEDYVNPRQFTREELEARFSAYEYSPENLEDIIEQITGQGGTPNYEAEQRAKAERFAKQSLALSSSYEDDYDEDSGFNLNELLAQQQSGKQQSDIGNILGKRGEEVTEDDVSFVTDIIAQQKAFNDLISEATAKAESEKAAATEAMFNAPANPDLNIDDDLAGITQPPEELPPPSPPFSDGPLYTQGTTQPPEESPPPSPPFSDGPQDGAPQDPYKVGKSIYDAFKDSFDFNKDDRIDDKDKTILEQIRDGMLPRAELPESSRFRSEGVQGELQETQRQVKETQQQIKEQEANRVQRETMQNEQALMRQLLATSPVDVKAPDPAEINYVYDPFGESIFATPEQEALFTGPYAQRSNTPPQGIAGVLGGRQYG